VCILGCAIPGESDNLRVHDLRYGGALCGVAYPVPNLYKGRLRRRGNRSSGYRKRDVVLVSYTLPRCDPPDYRMMDLN